MHYDIEKKIGIIDSYIEQLDSAISNNSYEEAKQLQNKIVAIFEPEIKSIKQGLENYLFAIGGRTVNYISDAQVLKAQLENYRANILAGFVRSQTNNESNINISQVSSQQMTLDVDITLESTVEIINRLPNDLLSEEEKEILNGKLVNLSAEQQKEKRWEKAKGALKWIAEKGIEVGIAALPYIVKMLEEAR